MTDIRSIARRWIEVWGVGNPASLPLADDFTHTSPFGTIRGRAKYLEIVEPMAEANVAALHVKDVIAEGNRAAILLTMDIPGATVDCCDWLVIEDNLIRSVHSHYDSRNISNFEKY